MHDQMLENRLRDALRAEGDSLPLTITAAELERRLALRRRGGLSPMASLGLAAAVGLGLLGLVGLAGGWFEQRTAVVSPSPSRIPASTAPSVEPSGEVVPLLPSLDERVAAHDQAIIVRAQAVGPAEGSTASEAPGPRSVTFAPVSVSGTYTVELSCLGPDHVTVAVTRGSNPEPYTDLPFACTGEVTGKLLDLLAGDHIVLQSDAPASWRLVVDAPAREPLRAPAIAVIAAPKGAESLLDARSETDAPDYGSIGTGGGVWVPVDVGPLPHRDQYRVRFSCAGPTSIRYALGDLADQVEPAVLAQNESITEVECDGAVHEDVLGLPLDQAQLIVTSSDQVAWHVVVTGDPLPIALAPDEGGWVMSTGFGPNYEFSGDESGVSLAGEEHGGDTRVVISCSGDTTITGTIDVGPVEGQNLDPFTLDCNGGAAPIARTYRDAASQVHVVFDPHGKPIWLAVTVQVRAPASPAP